MTISGGDLGFRVWWMVAWAASDGWWHVGRGDSPGCVPVWEARSNAVFCCL